MIPDSPHGEKMKIILPVASNASHCLASAPEEKLPEALGADEAMIWLDSLHGAGRKIEAMEFSGPGDVFSSWPLVQSCLELLRDRMEGSSLSVTGLGLNVQGLVPELQRYKISTVNLLVDAVTEETGLELYRWIRPGRKTLPVKEAVQLLLKEQQAAVTALSRAGITVVIRFTVREGVNSHEVSEVARKMAALGAAAMEIDGAEKYLQEVTPHLAASIYSVQAAMKPPGGPDSCTGHFVPGATASRPNVAVASSGGLEVDLHLGQADRLLIYGPREDGLPCLLESRKTPPAGAADRWTLLAEDLSDCFCLLASHAGDVPRSRLAEHGVKVLLSDDQIEGVVDMLYGGGKKGKCKQRKEINNGNS